MRGSLQDLFVGAWQQADPAVDQVPYTFPPLIPANLGKAQSKSSKPKKAQGKGKAKGLAQAQGRPPRQSAQGQVNKLQKGPGQNAAQGQALAAAAVADDSVPAQLAPRWTGVSAADYAQALYEDI